MDIRLLAPLGALCLAVPATAQVAAPMQPAAAAAPVSMLRAGTSVPLRTVVGLTTEGKALKVGHRFELETSEPITLNGQTVIPVGSRAMGEVTEVRNKGMWGKSGRINARMLHVRVGDRSIRLSGSIDDKGVTGTGGVVAAAALIPVAGFFVTGTSAKIPAGTAVSAFLEEDMPVTFAAAPAPLVVPASAPVAVPAAAPATAALPTAKPTTNR